MKSCGKVEGEKQVMFGPVLMMDVGEQKRKTSLVSVGKDGMRKLRPCRGRV